MAKPNVELSKKRGERVKALLKEYSMTQIELADKISFTPEHLNSMLNGKRTLTSETAERIAEIFPPVLPSWILCETDCRTKQQEEHLPLIKCFLEKKQRESAVLALLNSFDIAIEFNGDDFGDMANLSTANFFDRATEEDISHLLSAIDSRASSKRGYRAVRTNTGDILGYFSEQDRLAFIDEICEFVEFKLIRLIGGV